MENFITPLSTGISSLDKVLQGVIPGDNIVWQVDSLDHHRLLVHAFCEHAFKEKRKLIYFRFADHPALVPASAAPEIHQLNPQDGFENFISAIFTVIEKHGAGACYVFDSLSELTVDWYSDRMLGNFFMVTCPYLYDFETATYFTLLKNRHNVHTIKAIHTTAQVVIDVYSKDGALHIHPLKVYKRYTPTMYMLHEFKDGFFTPITSSAATATILSAMQTRPGVSTAGHTDIWSRMFERAQEIIGHGRLEEPLTGEGAECFGKLLRMAVTRDRNLLSLAEKYLGLSDMVHIGKRMIGTGLIGGKSVGMLLARAILRSQTGPWTGALEPHDSFFIGSDVFYTYLVENGCWWIRRRRKLDASFLEGAKEARQRLLSGIFPGYIRDQFMEMLDYFGQSPIIVRSSSLLEDNYGNAFSGKYESVFCANQGTPQERLEALMAAVRTVYASTMDREALLYRSQRNLLDKDEQMALLVQRVSGDMDGSLFFPQTAGVGFSFNPYVWHGDIDPAAGMVRMVLGLGTRAVNRLDDDYTRVVALNAPIKRPEANFDEVRKHTQRKVDVLDLAANRLAAYDVADIITRAGSKLPAGLFTSDGETGPMLSYERLFGETAFIATMRAMLGALQTAYQFPVDVEFTANFTSQGTFLINLVQCRPFQGKRSTSGPMTLPAVAKEATVFRTDGPVIGATIASVVDRIIYVVPSLYGGMGVQQRYAVARLIGKLNQQNNGKLTMLVGPGRWGTSTPSLGIPVSFSEINAAAVLCEIAVMHENLVPDVSLGTHFFNDLVETDMLYLAIFPDKKDTHFNETPLLSATNMLVSLLPEAEPWAQAVRVIDSHAAGPLEIKLHVNALTQHALCYIETPKH